MNKEQKRALRLLYFYCTPQPDKKPDDVAKDADWMKLVDHRNPYWWQIRDKLWNTLAPLIGVTTGKPERSAPASHRGPKRKK